MNIIEKVLPSSLIYPRKILTEAQKQLILKNSKTKKKFQPKKFQENSKKNFSL